MKMLKIISFIFWMLVIIGGVWCGYHWQVEKIGDPVCAGARIIIIGLLVGSFFISLFKIFRVISKANPPTRLNLSYWLVSFVLFILAFQWIGNTKDYSSPNYFYISYPDGGKALSVVFLWGLISLCWLFFNKFVKTASN